MLTMEYEQVIVSYTMYTYEVNPYMTTGFSHPYHLEELFCNLYFEFSNKFMSANSVTQSHLRLIFHGDVFYPQTLVVWCLIMDCNHQLIYCFWHLSYPINPYKPGVLFMGHRQTE